MTAGLPGTGIGGLFYLINAMWMPFHETIRLARGRSQSATPWAVIWTQTAIALAICFSIWITGWSLALTLTYLNAHGLVSYVPGHGMSHVLGHQLSHNVLGPMPFVIAGATLLLNLAIVHIARLFFSLAAEDQMADPMLYPGAFGEIPTQELGRATSAGALRTGLVRDVRSALPRATQRPAARRCFEQQPGS